jgi:hypothetical protein
VRTFRATVLMLGAALTVGLTACAAPAAPAAGPLAGATSVTTPETTPDGGPASPLQFAGATVDGGRFDAATLAGTPVVLWFWAPF